jgi:HEAT repeat protein
MAIAFVTQISCKNARTPLFMIELSKFRPYLQSILNPSKGKRDRHPSQPTPSWTTIPKTVAEEWFTSFLTDHHNFNISKVTASEWLEDLLEWHLLQVANDSEYIEFPHQLFQEYYAGEWLLNLIQKKNVTKDQIKHIYLNYLKWTESISFAISRLNHQSIVVQIIELSLDVTPKLGARLISEAKTEFQRSLIDLILQKQFSRRIKICLLGIARSDAAILYLNEELRKASKFFDRSYRATLVADADEIERMKILYFPELLEGWEEDASIRSLIASTLGEIGTINSINLLLKELSRALAIDQNCKEIRLEDIQNRIFNTADLINALRHHVYNENICNLITQSLKSGDSCIQKAAILVLSKSTNEKTISALISTLDSDDESVRYRAADALGIIGSEISIPALTDVALYDEDIGTRRAAIEGLQKINSDLPITRWIDALKDNNVNVRENAVQALGEYGDDKAVPHLINALDEGDPNIFTDIIFALGEIGSQEAISTLKEISLKNSNIRNRLACIWSLSKIGEEAIPILTLHLDSDDIQVRQRVTDALENIGGERVIPILEKILIENIENCVSIFADSAINKIKARLYGAEQECIRQCQEEMHRWNDFYHGPNKISKLHEEMKQPLSSEHSLTTIYWIQERYQFYNYEIVQSRFHDINYLKSWLIKFFPVRLLNSDRYILKGRKNVTNIFYQPGATVGVNVANDGSTIAFVQHTKENINLPEQDLVKAAQEIELLLTQLKNYPTITEPQQQTFIQKFLELIESTPDLIKVLLAGGIEGLKVLFAPVGIPVEMARRLIEVMQQRNNQL